MLAACSLGQPMTIEARNVNRGLRTTLWPALKAHGFSERTERVAWRYGRENIDVVEVQAIGQHAAAVGCTPRSLSVHVATYPPYLEESRLVAVESSWIPTRGGRLRPHYWHCDPFSSSMRKTLAQPWFRPFRAPMDERRPLSFRLHEVALRKLTSRAVHDVPEIWYMRDDGSNLDENLLDMTAVVLTAGLGLLDEWREPERVLELLETDRLLAPDSPHAFYLKDAIEENLVGKVGPPQD